MSRHGEEAIPHSVEVRSFKWPYRPTSVAVTHFLGEDLFGDPWWSADRSRFGAFTHSFVKLVPQDSFWTACFNSADPVVDVVHGLHQTGTHRALMMFRQFEHVAPVFQRTLQTLPRNRAFDFAQIIFRVELPCDGLTRGFRRSRSRSETC